MKKTIINMAFFLGIMLFVACGSDEYVDENVAENYVTEAGTEVETTQPDYEEVVVAIPFGYEYDRADAFAFYHSLTDLEFFKRGVNETRDQPFSFEGREGFLEFAYAFLRDWQYDDLQWLEVLNNWTLKRHTAPEDSSYIDYEGLRAWLEETTPILPSFEEFFISREQLDIVATYIEMPGGHFVDWMWFDYFASTIDPMGLSFARRLIEADLRPRDVAEQHDFGALLHYYDGLPFDETTDNPRRILVRMYEAFLVMSIEFMLAHDPSALESSVRRATVFDREIHDWR